MVTKKHAIAFAHAVYDVIETIALITAAFVICAVLLASILAFLFLVVAAPFAAVFFGVLWPLQLFGVI